MTKNIKGERRVQKDVKKLNKKLMHIWRATYTTQGQMMNEWVSTGSLHT